jgi:hypothetical protein
MIALSCANPGDWQACAFKVCAALVVSERGTRIWTETSVEALQSLYSSLSALLADRLEHMGLPSGSSVDKASQTLLETCKDKKAQPDVVARAKLNTMLNVSFNIGAGVAPGTVCVVGNGSNNDREFNAAVPGINWAAIQAEIVERPNSPVIPILLEVTPPCDFAQAKAQTTRLLAGFLVGSDEKLKTAEYLRFLEPIWLESADVGSSGIYRIVLNSHYLFGVPLTTAPRWKGGFRLRSSVMGSVVGWLSAHMSRPGYASLR